MENGSINIPKVLMLIIYIFWMMKNNSHKVLILYVDVLTSMWTHCWPTWGVWIFVFWTMSFDLFVVAPNIFELRKMTVARNKKS